MSDPQLPDPEFPDGLTPDTFDVIWPFRSTRPPQLIEGGCVEWDGGPYGWSDAERAERMFKGWTALVGSGDMGLRLVPPGNLAISDPWIDDGWGRPIKISDEVMARLMAARETPTVRRPRRRPRPTQDR